MDRMRVFSCFNKDSGVFYGESLTPALLNSALSTRGVALMC